MTEFNIVNLNRHAEDGFIAVAHWTASQTDGELSASTYGTISFTKTDDMDLIPFETVTKEQVIGWVKGSLGVEGINAIDLSLAQNITDQKAPKVLPGTPWNS